jgi:cold shock CspA family protein
MRKGKIKFINQKSKFGFIIDTESSEEFYFSTSDLKIQPGLMEKILQIDFNFELVDSKRGPKAINIVSVEA